MHVLVSHLPHRQHASGVLLLLCWSAVFFTTSKSLFVVFQDLETALELQLYCAELSP